MTVPAQNNWWGTTDNNQIKARIFDFNDDYNLGTVLYSPKLSSSDQTAPAYVRSLDIGPVLPIGIQTGTFTVGFSRPMYIEDNPTTSFESPSSDYWTSKTGMQSARGHPAIALANNGKIVVFGGSYFSTLYASVEAYDLTANSWTVKTSMSEPRQYMGAATAPNGKIYVIGGENNSNVLNIVEEYDPETDTWATKASMPTARYSLGVVMASNGKIYAIGGCNSINFSGFLATVEEYDPVTNIWKTKASMPSAICDIGIAATDDGKIYTFGGYNGSFLKTVLEYNTSTDTWITKANMPIDRHNLAVSVASNGKIYTFGGGDWEDSTVMEYAPTLNTWKTSPNMPTPRSGLQAVTADNGKIYAIGGYSGVIQNVVEEYTPPDWGKQNVSEDPLWIDSIHFRASYDFTSLNPRGDYIPSVSAAFGGDGMQIAPYTGTAFQVNYAGYISDITAPLAPSVSACGSPSTGTLSAAWQANDPQSTIDLYRYAVGTKPGGTEVTSWKTTSGTSMSQSNLGLINGQTYYVSVQARNDGGLWSDYGSSAVTAGASTCSLSGRITDGSGNGIYGVIVSAGSGLTATTDAQGIYTFTALPAGSYTLVPSKKGYCFSPSSRSVTVPSASNLYFTGGPPILYLPLVNKK